MPISRAFMRRSVSTSARYRRRKSRSRSWPRSPRSCDCQRERGMKFGPASPADAIGGVTVHTLRQGPLVLKKGTTIGPAEVEALNKAGVKEIVVVRLEDGDVSEDAAAASIAQAVAGDGVNVERAFTGRANLFAAKAGMLVVDRAAVDRINDVDEAITFATLAAYKPVVEGEMIATVKLIPFGVEAKLRDAAVTAAAAACCGSRPISSSASASSRPCCRGWRRRWWRKPCGSRPSGWRPPAPPSSPSAACRMTRPPGGGDQGIARPWRGTGDRVRRFRDRRPARRDSGGDLRISAAPSSISACRSIPETCC